MLYKCAANDPDDDIKKMLENFGEVISITHQNFTLEESSGESR